MGELDLDKIERALTLEWETENHQVRWSLEKEQGPTENIQPMQKVPVSS